MRPIRRKLHRALVGAVALAATATVALVIPAIVAPVNAALVPTVIKTSDFEDGTVQGWARRGTVETVANSTTVAHGGTRSLSITGRTASWNGPQLDMLGLMQKGTRYTFSVWVQLASGSSTTPMRLSVERRLGGTANYETLATNNNVSAGTWAQLTGGYTLGNDLDFLTVYVESVSGTPSFFIDDFSMSYIGPLPVQTGIPAVKDALATWFPGIGAAVAPAQLIGDRATLLKKHFNSVTPGNAMKWDATEPTAGNFVYTDADAIVNFATANSGIL